MSLCDRNVALGVVVYRGEDSHQTAISETYVHRSLKCTPEKCKDIMTRSASFHHQFTGSISPGVRELKSHDKYDAILYSR